jgi:phosphoserine phosphatase
MAIKNVIAVIFDFDDTLTPDSTSQLLLKNKKKWKIEPRAFWKKQVDGLTKDGWDSGCAFLHLLLKYMKDEKPPYTNEKLKKFGATLRPYPGLKGLFSDLRVVAKQEGFTVKFYIISGGIQDIVEGFCLRSEFAGVFDGVWGCQLAPEVPNGPVRYVKRVVTFTEKTRHLFEINKGIDPAEAARNPLAVNKFVPSRKRTIPFSQMIYVGDGISDIPCFSLVRNQEKFAGTPLGVFHPGEESARRAWLDLIGPKRVNNAMLPRYGKTQGLGFELRRAFQTMCWEIKLRSKKALVEEEYTVEAPPRKKMPAKAGRGKSTKR